MISARTVIRWRLRGIASATSGSANTQPVSTEERARVASPPITPAHTAIQGVGEDLAGSDAVLASRIRTYDHQAKSDVNITSANRTPDQPASFWYATTMPVTSAARPTLSHKTSAVARHNAITVAATNSR